MSEVRHIHIQTSQQKYEELDKKRLDKETWKGLLFRLAGIENQSVRWSCMTDIDPNKIDRDVQEEMALLDQWEKGEFESAKFAFGIDKAGISKEAISKLKEEVEYTNHYFGGEVLEIKENNLLNELVFVVTHYYKSPPIPHFVNTAMIKRRIKEEHPESFKE